MKKFLAITILLGLLAPGMKAQELNCSVEVISAQIGDVDKSVFNDMQTFIKEFMNNRKWTNDKFKVNERIKCSLILNIKEANINANTYAGELQVISSRPVFNSGYESPVMNLKDNNVSFSYIQGNNAQFNPQQFTNNLLHILGFYAYLIIGYDYDTFELKGGSPYYETARQIVMSAQGSSSQGWKAFESDKNRYWLVENIMHQTFEPLRKCLYEYHRLGLDKMYEKPEEGRAQILESLKRLNSVHDIKPMSYNAQVFFLAKREELENIFTEAPSDQRNEAYKVCARLDPGNLDDYEEMKKGS